MNDLIFDRNNLDFDKEYIIRKEIKSVIRKSIIGNQDSKITRKSNFNSSGELISDEKLIGGWTAFPPLSNNNAKSSPKLSLHKKIFTYREGKLTKTTESIKDHLEGEIQTIITKYFHYDKNQLLKIVSETKNGSNQKRLLKSEYEVNYSYDSLNRIAKLIESYSIKSQKSGFKTIHEHEYFRTKNGQISVENLYSQTSNSDGNNSIKKLISESQFKYNSDGLLVAILRKLSEENEKFHNETEEVGYSKLNLNKIESITKVENGKERRSEIFKYGEEKELTSRIIKSHSSRYNDEVITYEYS